MNDDLENEEFIKVLELTIKSKEDSEINNNLYSKDSFMNLMQNNGNLNQVKLDSLLNEIFQKQTNNLTLDQIKQEISKTKKNNELSEKVNKTENREQAPNILTEDLNRRNQRTENREEQANAFFTVNDVAITTEKDQLVDFQTFKMKNQLLINKFHKLNQTHSQINNRNNIITELEKNLRKIKIKRNEEDFLTEEKEKSRKNYESFEKTRKNDLKNKADTQNVLKNSKVKKDETKLSSYKKYYGEKYILPKNENKLKNQNFTTIEEKFLNGEKIKIRQGIHFELDNHPKNSGIQGEFLKYRDTRKKIFMSILQSHEEFPIKSVFQKEKLLEKSDQELFSLFKNITHNNKKLNILNEKMDKVSNKKNESNLFNSILKEKSNSNQKNNRELNSLQTNQSSNFCNYYDPQLIRRKLVGNEETKIEKVQLRENKTFIELNNKRIKEMRLKIESLPKKHKNNNNHQKNQSIDSFFK